MPMPEELYRIRRGVKDRPFVGPLELHPPEPQTPFPGIGPEAIDDKLQHLQHLTSALGYKLRLRQMDRPLSEQLRLYAQGRTAPGPIVTNAEPGLSLHGRHRAFDVDLLDENGHPITNPYIWQKIANLGYALGLVWGGDFSTISGDYGHFELPSKLNAPPYSPHVPIPPELMTKK